MLTTTFLSMVLFAMILTSTPLGIGVSTGKYSKLFISVLQCDLLVVYFTTDSGIKSMAKRKSYMDIGHDREDGITLWIFYNRRLATTPREAGTHAEVWGDSCLDCWRGRFDHKTKELSAIAPANAKAHVQMPTWVKDALDDEFGEYHLTSFNPQGEEM